MTGQVYYNTGDNTLVCTHCETCTRVWVPPVTQLRSREVCVRPACMSEIDVPGASYTERICCDPGSC